MSEGEILLGISQFWPYCKKRDVLKKTLERKVTRIILIREKSLTVDLPRPLWYWTLKHRCKFLIFCNQWTEWASILMSKTKQKLLIFLFLFGTNKF